MVKLARIILDGLERIIKIFCSFKVCDCKSECCKSSCMVDNEPDHKDNQQ